MTKLKTKKGKPMVDRTKNNQLSRVIIDLKTLAIEKKVPLWKRIAVELEKPTRRRREVNVYKLEKYTEIGDVIVVPGKVLGSGNLTKKITVAAVSISESAKEKIVEAKGQVMSIEELMKKNPAGSKVKIMG
jgi:large subunit ribosomal protein L18e